MQGGRYIYDREVSSGMNHNFQEPHRGSADPSLKGAVLYVVMMIVLFVAVALFAARQSWHIILLLILVGVALYFLVTWHARTTGYGCAKCGHEFNITALTDLISPHVPGKKYLKCPSCHRRTWARERKRRG
ncbi:MAG: hypothetical protein JSW03_07660 [Candidatus Eiseniibacteriota bacterium]|nr:MAG: hypothetical protein JSW03_07660 [Candidatus Eisenbacteria bacterium]